MVSACAPFLEPPQQTLHLAMRVSCTDFCKICRASYKQPRNLVAGPATFFGPQSDSNQMLSCSSVSVLNEGWANKESRYLSRWRKRWLILCRSRDDDRLFLCTYKTCRSEWVGQSSSMITNPTECICLDGAMLSATPTYYGRASNFVQLRTREGHRIFCFEMPTPVERDRWARIILHHRDESITPVQSSVEKLRHGPLQTSRGGGGSGGVANDSDGSGGGSGGGGDANSADSSLATVEERQNRRNSLADYSEIDDYHRLLANLTTPALMEPDPLDEGGAGLEQQTISPTMAVASATQKVEAEAAEALVTAQEKAADFARVNTELREEVSRLTGKHSQLTEDLKVAWEEMAELKQLTCEYKVRLQQQEVEMDGLTDDVARITATAAESAELHKCELLAAHAAFEEGRAQIAEKVEAEKAAAVAFAVESAVMQATQKVKAEAVEAAELHKSELLAAHAAFEEERAHIAEKVEAEKAAAVAFAAESAVKQATQKAEAEAAEALVAAQEKAARAEAIMASELAVMSRAHSAPEALQLSKLAILPCNGVYHLQRRQVVNDHPLYCHSRHPFCLVFMCHPGGTSYWAVAETEGDDYSWQNLKLFYVLVDSSCYTPNVSNEEWLDVTDGMENATSVYAVCTRAVDRRPAGFGTWTGRFARADMFALHRVEGAALSAMRAIIDVPDPHNLAIGNDASRWTTSQNKSLKLLQAWRVENDTLAAKYTDARTEVGRQINRLLTALPESDRPALINEMYGPISELLQATGDELDSFTNETFLLHGAPPHVICDILADGMNQRFSKPGFFGEGTYFAENACKSDQYADSRLDPRDHTTSTTNDNVRKLHEKLYRGDTPPKGDVFYIIVCRVVMGWYARTKHPIFWETFDGELKIGGHINLDIQNKLRPDRPQASTPAGPDDWALDIWAKAARGPEQDRQQELTDIPGGPTPGVAYHALLAEVGGMIKRHREFVQFHADRVYPSYVLAYQRIADGQVMSKH